MFVVLFNLIGELYVCMHTINVIKKKPDNCIRRFLNKIFCPVLDSSAVLDLRILESLYILKFNPSINIDRSAVKLYIA